MGIYTRRTGRGRQDATRLVHPHRHRHPGPGVSATTPSIPAVLRPALRWVTCRTLTSVLPQRPQHQLLQVPDLGQSPAPGFPLARRQGIEDCFAEAKSEAGLDHYQVRKYRAWYRHATLSMLAHAFLAVTARASRPGAPRPHRPCQRERPGRPAEKGT